MFCRTALAAGILAIAPAAAADEGRTEIWLNPGMFSHHLKEDRQYREENYGFGVEAFITPRHGLFAGSVMNSNDERSRYLGYHWRPLQRSLGGVRFSAGLALGLVDGYSDVRDGKAFPIVLPALSTEYRALGAHVMFLPHPNRTSALGLQLRLRIW